MRTGSPLNPDEPVTLTGSIPRISDVIMSVILPPGTGCKVVDAPAVAPGALVAPGAASPPESSPQPAASNAPAERMNRHLRQFFIKAPLFDVGIIVAAAMGHRSRCGGTRSGLDVAQSEARPGAVTDGVQREHGEQQN